jgi:hypothetical protein
VVVEGDGTVEVGERDSKTLRHIPQGALRKVPVPFVKSVENGEERCGFAPPMGDDLLVRPDSHLRLQSGGCCPSPLRKVPRFGRLSPQRMMAKGSRTT